MTILITGANGFIGKNLQVRLKDEGIEYTIYTRGDSVDVLEKRLNDCDFIVHLAGINRPDSESEFHTGNAELSQTISELLQKNKCKVPVIYSSSIQADQKNPYGLSKKAAEKTFEDLREINGNKVFIYRLPNVFGKWCRPNYNSAVATFCNNIINDLPIKINDPDAPINLVYVDDVVIDFINIIQNHSTETYSNYQEVSTQYKINVGDLVKQLRLFKNSRYSHVIEEVGCGLTRALYSTYISYFSPNQFTYDLVKHEDPRGVFVEMLKTKKSGQFSFFTAHPGITRGGHYHHSKNEKFLVLQGKARFKFRNIITDVLFEIETNGDVPQVVETVPGWSHDITNIGTEKMFVMLWANEIFDPENPDTINHKV
jgi:UDP-2-acetamido-2,6-beta-L-arabino-hexul-4-ose reductase